MALREPIPLPRRSISCPRRLRRDRSSNDCEPGWIFVAIRASLSTGCVCPRGDPGPGITHGRADEVGAARRSSAAFAFPVVEVTNPRTIVPLLCRSIYSSPATRDHDGRDPGTNGTTSYLMRAALASRCVLARNRRLQRRPRLF